MASEQKKKKIKLATKSEHAGQFFPMLEALAAKGKLNSIITNRVEKACALLDSGLELFANDFKKNIEVSEINERYGQTDADNLASLNQVFYVAGRVMSWRSFGKATFFHISNRMEQVQCFATREGLGLEAYQLFKKCDIGDIVGVVGKLFRTKTGELTLECEKVQLLTKTFRPLPDKQKGLKDIEMRYRRRYVDLIVTAHTKEVFVKRARTVQALRHFLDTRGFMEVETPMMHPIPGGATARPFATHHNALDMQLYMRIAPELYLKRLLVGGCEKVYEINRNFRNEGTSTQHNPEFTMLEFYWAYADFYDLMNLTEEMFSFVAEQVTGSPQVLYQGEIIDLSPGTWQRVSFHDSLEKIGGVSPEIYTDYEKCVAFAKEQGEKIIEGEKLGKIQAKLFDSLVEPKLIQPHFIYHYPTDISPLSRRNADDPHITDRFELFMTGREVANAFSELNDPMDQRLRFEEQVAEKEAGDEEAHYMDEDYLRALEYGMPPAAGQGVGIDRLVMLLTNSASIREVILFPLLRPEG